MKTVYKFLLASVSLLLVMTGYANTKVNLNADSTGGKIYQFYLVNHAFGLENHYVGQLNQQAGYNRTFDLDAMYDNMHAFAQVTVSLPGLPDQIYCSNAAYIFIANRTTYIAFDPSIFHSGQCTG